MDAFRSSLPEDAKRVLEEVKAFREGLKPYEQEWKGIQLIPFFSKEAAQFAYEKWSPKQGDVFVVTYPKSGTHWMDEIVTQTLFISDPNYDLATDGKLKFTTGQTYLEDGPVSKFVLSDYFPRRRIFDTHLPEELINYDEIKKKNAKVIYVYRNPKDLAVSYYHFNKKLPWPKELQYMIIDDWNEYLASFVEGKMHTAVPRGEWYPYHIKSWIKHRGDGTTMFVSFEDLKKDLQSEIRRIAKFLGVERTEDEVKEIARRCGFETMKKEKENQFLSQLMYRKGQVGSWKDQFTVAQSEMMDKMLKEQLAGVDIDFTYEI